MQLCIQPRLALPATSQLQLFSISLHEDETHHLPSLCRLNSKTRLRSFGEVSSRFRKPIMTLTLTNRMWTYQHATRFANRSASSGPVSAKWFRACRTCSEWNRPRPQILRHAIDLEFVERLRSVVTRRRLPSTIVYDVSFLRSRFRYQICKIRVTSIAVSTNHVMTKIFSPWNLVMNWRESGEICPVQLPSSRQSCGCLRALLCVLHSENKCSIA